MLRDPVFEGFHVCDPAVAHKELNYLQRKTDPAIARRLMRDSIKIVADRT
jgi:hypothetical protein